MKTSVQNNSNAPSKLVKPIVLIRLGFAQFLLHWTYCKIPIWGQILYQIALKYVSIHSIKSTYLESITYSRVRNKHSPTLINFLTFFQGLRPYSGLHRAYLSSISIRYKWGYAYSFCQIFQGLRLFKGVRLFQTLEYPLLDKIKKISWAKFKNVQNLHKST